MQELNCPKCGQAFKIDESGYSEILKQVRDQEFDRTLKDRLALAELDKETAIKLAESAKDAEIQILTHEMQARELAEKIALGEATSKLKESFTAQLQLKEEELAKYKDFKAKQSTKMVGESLEQHCEIEFNKLRATGFTKAYFEKDSEIRANSKGDYIFKDFDEEGNEYIEIMFELKN
jgi:hypothetical protein